MTRRQFRLAVKNGEPAVRDLARGLRNTDEQIRYAKRVESTFGNWGKTGPAARRFLTTWAPFWMWSRAALKFVFATLPKDHPIITALYATSESMTREERKKLGFDFAAKVPLPDFLQGGLPAGGGGEVSVSNLSSFGYAADIPGNLATVPAPQFSGIVLSGLGLDWKGDKLVNADGSPASAIDRVKAAFTTTAESYVPFLNPAKQFAKRGPSGLLPAHPYPKDYVNYERNRSNQQTISVPIKGLPQLPDGSSSSSGGSNPFSAMDGTSSSSGNPFSAMGSSGASNPFSKMK